MCVKEENIFLDHVVVTPHLRNDLDLHVCSFVFFGSCELQRIGKYVVQDLLVYIPIGHEVVLTYFYT